MQRLHDWTRGLPDFLRFLGIFLILSGIALGLVWTAALTSGGEIWAFAFFGLLGVVLGIACLVIAWLSKVVARRRAPGDQAV